MRNRDMPAKPNVIDLETMRLMGNTSNLISDVGKFNSGLTKLEYAAIHIHVANLQRSPYAIADEAIDEANLLFDELDKQQ